MAEYAKLIEALRICAGFVEDPSCAKCAYSLNTKCKSTMMQDAAAAIEALQAEVERLEPKLGEWQKAKPKGVVTYSDGYAECSHCHETIWLGWGMNFCPHCGTQNKIIDPDDYDGAKMEVQE